MAFVHMYIINLCEYGEKSSKLNWLCCRFVFAFVCTYIKNDIHKILLYKLPSL